MANGFRFFTVNATPSLSVFLSAPSREALRVVYHKKTPEHLLPGLHEVVIKVRVPIAIADRDGVEREQFRQILRNFFGRIVKVAKVVRPPWPLPWTLEMMDSSEQLQQLLEFHVQECLGSGAGKRGVGAGLGDARPAKRRSRDGLPIIGVQEEPILHHHPGPGVTWTDPQVLAVSPALLRLRERGNSPRGSAGVEANSAMCSLATLAALARGGQYAVESRKAVDASTMWSDPSLFHRTPAGLTASSSSSSTNTALEALGHLAGGWAFFVIRTEPRWPIPLEPGAAPPKLDVTYTGITNPETIMSSDVMMAIGTKPIRDLSFVVTVVRTLENGLGAAVADAISTRCRTPYATEFPLIVRGDCAFIEDLKTQLINGFRACLQSSEQKYPLAAQSMTRRGPIVILRDPNRPSPYYRINDGGRQVNGPYGLAALPDQAQGFLLTMDSVLHTPGRGDLVPLGSISREANDSMQVALSFWKLYAGYIRQCFGHKATPHDNEADVTILLQNATIRANGGPLGLPIAVHLATLFTPRKTHENIAVTGAISLSGAVMPVYDLRLMIEAAYRDGITNIALPTHNIAGLESGDGSRLQIVDIEPQAESSSKAPFAGGEGSGAAAVTTPAAATAVEVDVALSSQVYDAMKFYAVSTVFDCLHLALHMDSNNVHEVPPPPPPIPRELRVVKTMEWTYMTGAIQQVEVAILPCGRGRCHITGNLSEGATKAIQAAIEALHGNYKFIASRATAGGMMFTLPLVRHDMHINLPGLREKEGRDVGMAAAVGLLSLMLQEPVPADAAFVGEVNAGGLFYQCRDMDALQLEVARRANIKRLFVPRMTAESIYTKDRLPMDFRGEREVVGVATLGELIQCLWPPRHDAPPRMVRFQERI